MACYWTVCRKTLQFRCKYKIPDIDKKLDVLFIIPDSSAKAYLDLVENTFDPKERKNVGQISQIRLKQQLQGY